MTQSIPIRILTTFYVNLIQSILIRILNNFYLNLIQSTFHQSLVAMSYTSTDYSLKGYIPDNVLVIAM